MSMCGVEDDVWWDGSSNQFGKKEYVIVTYLEQKKTKTKTTESMRCVFEVRQNIYIIINIWSYNIITSELGNGDLYTVKHTEM